jgi:hypothetical protein
MKLRHIFAVPALLALLSLVGLIAALTGDGWRDLASWVALGIPVAVIGWAYRNRTS